MYETDVLGKRRRHESIRSAEPPRPNKRPRTHAPNDKHDLSPDFWNNLSHVHLTKGALKELQRQLQENAQLPISSASPRGRRPWTRSRAAQANSSATGRAASDFLRRCSRDEWDELKRFARHRGFDLHEVRGVSVLSPCGGSGVDMVPVSSSAFLFRNSDAA